MENKKNFYIDGKWVTPKSKEEIKVINPATEENCAIISLGNKEDVDLAVRSAKKAYSSWSFSTKVYMLRLQDEKVLSVGPPYSVVVPTVYQSSLRGVGLYPTVIGEPKKKKSKIFFFNFFSKNLQVSDFEDT